MKCFKLTAALLVLLPLFAGGADAAMAEVSNAASAVVWAITATGSPVRSSTTDP